MKVAFSGAGGTGKTTLAKMLAKEVGLPYLPSRIKETAVKFGFDRNYRQALPNETKRIFQYSILNGQIVQETTATEIAGGFIAERSAIDYLPYYAEIFGNVEEIYKNMAIEQAQASYDVIFYLPLEFEPQDNDTWRERDFRQRYITDTYIKNTLDSTDFLRFFTITGSIEKRFEEIKKILKI